MSKNSYDVSGIKCGLVLVDNPNKVLDDYERRYRGNTFDSKVKSNALEHRDIVRSIIDGFCPYSLVDFNDVAGLNVSEATELLDEKLMYGNFILLIYAEATEVTADGKFMLKRLPLYAARVNSDDYRYDTKMEDAFGNLLSTNFSDNSIVYDRKYEYIKCFLERYVYGNKAATDNSILSLDKKGRNKNK